MPLPLSEFARIGDDLRCRFRGLHGDCRDDLPGYVALVSEPAGGPRRVHETTRTQDAGARPSVGNDSLNLVRAFSVTSLASSAAGACARLAVMGAGRGGHAARAMPVVLDLGLVVDARGRLVVHSRELASILPVRGGARSLDDHGRAAPAVLAGSLAGERERGILHFS